MVGLGGGLFIIGALTQATERNDLKFRLIALLIQEEFHLAGESFLQLYTCAVRYFIADYDNSKNIRRMSESVFSRAETVRIVSRISNAGKGFEFVH